MQTQAAFYYGLGAMGVLAGLGLGSKCPNKVALLVGVGSLFYANHLSPVLEIGARPELTESYQQARRRLPFQNGGRASGNGFQFTFTPSR